MRPRAKGTRETLLSQLSRKGIKRYIDAYAARSIFVQYFHWDNCNYKYESERLKNFSLTSTLTCGFMGKITKQNVRYVCFLSCVYEILLEVVLYDSPPPLKRFLLYLSKCGVCRWSNICIIAGNILLVSRSGCSLNRNILYRQDEVFRYGRIASR